jgi:hypothetical protein
MKFPRILLVFAALLIACAIETGCGGSSYGNNRPITPPPPPTGTNYTTCNSNGGGNQLVPNWESPLFISQYQTATKALIDHVSQASYKNSIGYIRIGLGKGGEINLPPGWDNSSSGACDGGYTGKWGYTAGASGDNWNQYLQTMVQWEHSTLNSPFPLLVSITPITDVGVEPDDFIAQIADQNGVSFGNQGLQASDITNFDSNQPCGGDWCNLFPQYHPQIAELQTLGQSCPSGLNACPSAGSGINSIVNNTGSLASGSPSLLDFATSHGANDLELYYEDWLVGFYPGYSNPVDPNSGQFQSAYATAITSAASSAKMQILFPPTTTSDPDFPGVQSVISGHSNIVTGVVLDVDWSDFDLGSGNSSGNYDWTITDGEINLYVSMGVKVNLVLQNTTYGGDNCSGNSSVGSNGQNNSGNCAMPAWMWTVLH